MQTKSRRTDQFILTLLGSIIPVSIVVGTYFEISSAALITLTIVTALMFGWLLIWSHANQKATGKEWWQDDECSGWRGY